MVFCLKDLYPVSSVMIFDYIGGISNEYFHIDEVFNYLKKHPYVLSVKKTEIHHWNQRPNYTIGLHMEILFPNQIYKKMWDHVKKRKYPSYHMSELVCSPERLKKSKIDPLGIKKFLKSEKQIKEENID